MATVHNRRCQSLSSSLFPSSSSSSSSSITIIITIIINIVITMTMRLKLNLPSPRQHCYNHVITWLSSSFVVTIFNTYTYINSITVIVSLHRVTITYWLAFITHTEKHNDPNFHLSLSPKHYRHFHLLHEPHNVRWEATYAKYPNCRSTCWQLKKSWTYLFM